MNKVKSTLIFVTILIVTSNFSFSQKSKIDAEFQKFWQSFSSAVQMGDKEKVAEMVEFPLMNQISESESLDKADFLKYFDIIFLGNKGDYKKLELKKVSGKNGEFSYSEIENGRTDMALNFNLTKDGLYKFTSLLIPAYDANIEGWKSAFEENYKILQKYAPQRKFEKFFREFKSALKKGDKRKIAEIVQYPNNSFFTEVECRTSEKENFVKCYKKIFSKGIISSLLRTKIDEVEIITDKTYMDKLNSGGIEYVIDAFEGSMIYIFHFTSINGNILLFKSEWGGTTN